MIDRHGLGLDLQDHFFTEDVADQTFIKPRQWVEREAVGQFPRAHPKKAFGLTCDQGIDLPGNIFNVHIDRDDRHIQIILQDAISAVERAVGLGVEVLVTAAKIIRSCCGAGFEEGTFKVREPEFFLAGAEGCFFDSLEKSVLVRHNRDRDAAEGSQDALGQRRPRGIFIQINMIDLGDLF